MKLVVLTDDEEELCMFLEQHKNKQINCRISDSQLFSTNTMVGSVGINFQLKSYFPDAEKFSFLVR